MYYFRSIYSSIILFLISIIFIVNQSPIADGFETQGAVGPTSFDLGLPVHQDITREGLPFLKSDTLESIVSQHIKIEQDPSSPNHFDNCQFAETVALINQRYDAAVVNLNPTQPNLPQAEENFGYILHAAQDFYSHTNWVEMGRTDLIDPWLGHWRPLYGYTLSSNTLPVFILEENGKSNSDFQIYKNGKVIIVNHEMWDADGSGKKMGLISGTYDADVSKCPASASIPHGGRISTVINHISPLATDESRDLPDELNKDNPAMRGFWTARTLAVQQTTHEFCRLVDLVRGAYGDAGVKLINDNWVQPQYLIDSPANNSRCPTAGSTQVGLLQDSPTSVEEKIASIPSWVKRNAQYWSDGSLTDKDFATGIGYLVQQKIISANVTTNKDGTILVNDNLSIPKWIKNNAKYWSEGSISDTDFTSGIEYMVDQNIISFSEPVQKQDIISNDDLKLLYSITNQYEETAQSLLTLNDNQETVLKDLTANDWYKNTDPKVVSHVQVLDLMIKKQNVDNDTIQHVANTIHGVSEKIKEYAIKQGVSSSELEPIAKTPPQNTVTPMGGLVSTVIIHQDALRRSSYIATPHFGSPTTYSEGTGNTNLVKAAGQLANILGNGYNDLENLRWDNPEKTTDTAFIQSLLVNHSGDLSAGEIDILKTTLESQGYVQDDQVYGVDKQNVIDLMQKAIDLLNAEEQQETDSIFKYITDTSMLDLSPVEKSLIQLQSKHGSYEPVGDSDTYVVSGLWVLQSQNGIEHKNARYHIFSTTNIYYNIQGDAKIEEGVIKASSALELYPLPPGTWFLELLTIDGNLPPPTDSRIEVVIPSKSSVPSTPTTVQTTPIVPTTPLTQTSLEFTVPSQIVQEATSSSGATVSFTTTFSSPGGSSSQIITCNPTSGSQFPLGNTVVTCTATDLQSQKTLKKSFTVIVRDTTPPAISPFNPHNDQPDDSGAIVYFTMEAIDLVDGSVTPHCDHSSGSKFSIGTTIVTCTADDSHGNHSERKLGITITKS